MLDNTHRIEKLERKVLELEKQLFNLQNPIKNFEQVQDDWAKRNLGILDKGPLPYAHKTGHAGSVTVGDNHD